MPELPEVETVRRGLSPPLTGAEIVAVRLHRPDLRFAFPPDFAARLTGRRIEAVGRRGKFLLFALSDGVTWLAHLGMTGSFRVATAPPAGASAPPHIHLELDLAPPDGAPIVLSYADARRFGFMELFAVPADSRFLGALGPEPLGEQFDADWLAHAAAGRRSPVKSLLMDQSVVAGLGNIYASEALFRARLTPRRRADALVTGSGAPRAALARLAAAIPEVLGEAIEAGGSTLRDFRASSGELGRFQHRFEVYGRAGEPCLRPACTGTIRRIVQAGRASFFCPVCQR
jgi:formamidopyrimidine-DNA glycosylase